MNGVAPTLVKIHEPVVTVVFVIIPPAIVVMVAMSVCVLLVVPDTNTVLVMVTVAVYWNWLPLNWWSMVSFEPMAVMAAAGIIAKLPVLEVVSIWK